MAKIKLTRRTFSATVAKTMNSAEGLEGMFTKALMGKTLKEFASEQPDNQTLLVDGMSQMEQEDLFVKNTLMGCAAYVLIPIAMLVLVFLFEGCATGRSVMSERVSADTVTVTHWRHDSIYVETLRTDSIVVRQEGDTIIFNHWRTEWRDRWRDRIVHDSIYIHHTDTLLRETVVEKPGKMTAWQRVRMTAGMVAMAVLGVAVLVWTKRR